ncbi:MAG: EF-hand domain-containing protein, partial [Candidatus Poseidoniaceae archaeon]|nr:EF-hand domain-containing protein [Candidatus Poseidoniaceae archaeon]
MSEEENQDIPMAECGACRAIIPLDSESCSNCNIRFGGVSEEELGECGACGELQPADSVSCSKCGVSFISEEVDSVDEIETPPVVEEVIEDDIEVSTEEENDSEEAEEEDDSAEEEADDEDDSAEDEAEEEDDSAEEESDEDDSEEDEAEEEDDSAEEESDEDDSEEDEAEEKDDSATIMAFESLALAIAESGMTAGEAFAEMDSSDDNMIDAPELQKGIEKIGGDKLSPSEVTAILNYLDTNEDRRVDANELVKALEDLRIGIKPGKIPKIKQFPSPMQKMLMGKKANDVFYPIAYFLMVTFIGLWVVNGMGLLVDGTGGNIIYEGHTDATGNDVE